MVIGDQVWMKRNLAVDVGNNLWVGSTWWFLSEDGPSTREWVTHYEYGRLYDWETAMHVCPPGWTLPSMDDFYELWRYSADSLGGFGMTAGHLRITQTGGEYRTILGTPVWTEPHPMWYEPNWNATNLTGFSAIPAGRVRVHTGNMSILNIGQRGYYWSSGDCTYHLCHFWSPTDSTKRSNAFEIRYNEGGPRLIQGHPHNNLFSVRCIKGNPSIKLRAMTQDDRDPGTIATFEGAGEYEIGEVVTIFANPKPGVEFVQWLNCHSYIEDPYSPVTTITVPNANIIIYAEFIEH